MSVAMISFILGGIFCGVPMMIIAATVALEAAEHRRIYKDRKINQKERMNMKEVTRIITLEVTLIDSVEDENFDKKYMPKEVSKKIAETRLKKFLSADHLLVTNVQDFIRDVQV